MPRRSAVREHCVEGLSVYILDRGRAALRHTYNSLGDYEKAEDYLRQALKFIEQEAGMNKGNRGGALRLKVARLARSCLRFSSA